MSNRSQSSKLLRRLNQSLLSVIRKIKKGWTSPDTGKIQPFQVLLGYVGVDLTLADSEHLRTAGWTYALGCRLSVFHGYGLSILHFLFSAALHTVCLHLSAPFNFILRLNYYSCKVKNLWIKKEPEEIFPRLLKVITR